MSVSQPAQPRFKQLLADPTLDAALAWQAETTHHPLDGAVTKEELRARLASGEYAFAPLRRVQTADGPVDQWEETDRIVLKALTLVLHAALGDEISPHVYHLHGDSKAAVSHVQEHLADNPGAWVVTSDVAGYYEHIDHALLYHQMADRLPDEPYLLRLVWQYLRHSVEEGGEYRDIEQGLARGCPLSPLLGALYLKPLDELLEREGVGYARYRDEWVALFPTRWALRRAEAQTNVILDGLKLAEHPPKTFIGRAERGFDLLGYHLAPGAAPAVSGGARPAHEGGRGERTVRLQEQGADSARIERYLSRWQDWAQGGIRETVIVPRPAARPSAIKRLSQLGGGVATVLSAGAGVVTLAGVADGARAAIVPFTLVTTDADKFGVGLGYKDATAAGLSIAAVAAFFPGPYVAYSVSVAMSISTRGGDGWRFRTGTPATVTPTASSGASGSIAVGWKGGGSTSDKALATLPTKTATKNIFFSNGTGAGWATLSYDPSQPYTATVTGAVNTGGAIIFRLYTAPPPAPSVPEPSSLALLVSGAAALGFSRRRRRARGPADSTTGA